MRNFKGYKLILYAVMNPDEATHRGDKHSDIEEYAV